jgi:hypothetical protein
MVGGGWRGTVHYLIKNKACKLDIEKIYFDVEGLYGRSPLLQKRREESA